jgi:cytochrome-b5 reductase
LQLARAVTSNQTDKTQLSLIFANVTEADILLRKEIDELQAHPQFKRFYVLEKVSLSSLSILISFCTNV